MSIFIAIVVSFGLGVVFGGRRAWMRGLAHRNWLWWKVPTLSATMEDKL